MVIQLEVLNLVGASSLLIGEEYILDSAILVAELTNDLPFRHA